MAALRDYQQHAVDECARQIARSRSTVLVCPTGGGKTIMGATASARHIARNSTNSVLWLAHRRELVQQAARQLQAVSGQSVRTIVAGRSTGDGRITVASVDTVRNWSDLPAASLVVVDECHHARASTWQALIGRYAGAYRLGLTATPQRHDGRGLGDVFASMVVSVTIRQLTDAGYLAPCHVYAPAQLRDGLAMAPLPAWQQFAHGRPAVIFCTTVDQAQRHADEFAAAGHTSAVIAGTSRSADRDSVLADFAAGKITTLCNVAVLTEGWDCPSAGVAILARGCSHAGLYLQIVGRVLRAHESKRNATLIDLRGVVNQHGMPDADREYTLSDDPIRPTGEAAIAQCKACGAVYEWAPKCPRCGYQSPPMPRRIRMDPAELKQRFAADTDDQRAEYLRRLQQTAQDRGYRNGWVTHMYRVKYGE